MYWDPVDIPAELRPGKRFIERGSGDEAYLSGYRWEAEGTIMVSLTVYRFGVVPLFTAARGFVANQAQRYAERVDLSYEDFSRTFDVPFRRPAWGWLLRHV